MITKDYAAFFKGLEKNNHKEWFHDHKKDYENHVKGPFLELLDGLIPRLRQLEPRITLNAKDALFRINRDIRFSKDKSPYNTLMKAGFSPGGKKSELPGFYLGIGANTIHVGGGLFNVSTPSLKAVRNHIAQHTDEFVAIVEEPSFKETFGELKGDRAKRLDKDHQAVLVKTPYIANKQFFAMGDLPLKDHLGSEGLSDFVFQRFEQVAPLNQFIGRVIS